MKHITPREAVLEKLLAALIRDYIGFVVHNDWHYDNETKALGRVDPKLPVWWAKYKAKRDKV